MKYNYQYIKIGKIKETKKGWKLNLKTDEGKLKEIFTNLDLAIKYAENYIKELHKHNEVPVSVEYVRISGAKTFLCYEAGEKPKEYAAFDYIGFNSSFHKSHERRTYMTPRFISYNAVARISAAEKVGFRRVKNFFDAALFAIWIATVIVAVKYSFFPTTRASGQANITGAELISPIAYASIFAAFGAIVAFLIADNIPRIIFWRKSNERINNKIRTKFYGESKDWKTYYRSRIIGNAIGAFFLSLSFSLLVISASFMGNSVYLQFDALLPGSIALFTMFALALVSLAIEATLKMYAIQRMRQKRSMALSNFVSGDLKPYFKAWSLFKGIKNEELDFIWDIFIYRPTKEELAKSYDMIKQNTVLSFKKKHDIKRSLIKDLKNGLDKIKTEKEAAKPKKEKTLAVVKEKAIAAKAARAKAEAERKASKVKEVETITKVVALEKNKKKQKSKTQKDLNKKAKELKKAEAKRIKDIRDAKRAEAKKAKAKKKN